jgi:hypothetical protein
MFVVCSVIVRSKVGSYGNGSIVKMIIKTALASVVAGAVVFAVSQGILNALVLTGAAAVIEAVVVVVICGVLGLIIAFGLCKLLRVPEYQVLDSILSKFKAKLLRR